MKRGAPVTFGWHKFCEFLERFLRSILLQKHSTECASKCFAFAISAHCCAATKVRVHFTTLLRREKQHINNDRWMPMRSGRAGRWRCFAEECDVCVKEITFTRNTATMAQAQSTETERETRKASRAPAASDRAVSRVDRTALDGENNRSSTGQYSTAQHSTEQLTHEEKSRSSDEEEAEAAVRETIFKYKVNGPVCPPGPGALGNLNYVSFRQ